MEKEIDYRALCWKLVDKLNEAWRKANGKGKNEYKYTFEFLPAESLYLYSSGYVAQIVDDKLRPVVVSKIGGLFPPGDGQNEPMEAFKSMIQHYLELFELNGNSYRLVYFNGLDIPKTIEEIAA